MVIHTASPTRRIFGEGFLLAVALLSLFLFSACSARNGATTTTSTSSNLGLTSNTVSNVTGNIFSNALSNTATGYVPTITTPVATTQTTQCLTQGAPAVGSATWYFDTATNQYVAANSASAAICIVPGATQAVSTDQFYQAGVDLYTDLDSCLRAVLERAPASDADAPAATQLGEMALVRCYQNIVRRNSAQIPWAQNQQQVYSNNQNTLAALLAQLAQMGF